MGGGGGQKCAYQKWPHQMFPMVNLLLSHDGPFGLGVGGGRGLWVAILLTMPPLSGDRRRRGT